LDIFAPNCECPLLPAPDVNSNTVINACYDGNTYVGEVSIPEPFIFHLATLVWYTTQMGMIETATGAPARSVTGTSEAWAAFRLPSGCESSTRTRASVTIKELPTATITSTSSTICEGEDADIEIALTGTPPWIVEYTDDGVTSYTPSIAASPYTLTVTPSLTSTYKLLSVTDGEGCDSKASGEVTFTVDKPSIAGDISPKNIAVCSGTNVAVTLENYKGNIQWQRSLVSPTEGFVNLPVSGTNILIAGNLTTTTYYRAVVQNGVCAAAVSDVVTVTVVPQPTLTTPSNTTICASSNATLSSVFSGGMGTVATAQWQYSTDDITWNNVVNNTPSNATYSIAVSGNEYRLNISNIDAPGAYLYRLHITMTGSGCEATSAPATLTVIPPSNVGTITADDLSVCKYSGTTLKLTGYTGAIQWQSSTISGTTGFTNILSATAATLSTGSLLQPTWYRVIVKNGICDSKTSTAVKVDVVPLAEFDVSGIVKSDAICESQSHYQLPDWNLNVTNGYGKWKITSVAKGTLSITDEYETNGVEVVTFTFSVYNNTGTPCNTTTPVASQIFTLSIKELPKLSVTEVTCDYLATDSPYSVGVTVSEGTTPYTVTATSGTVAPSGGNKWIISNISANLNITVTVKDALGCSYTLPITAPNCDCPTILPPATTTNTDIIKCEDGNTYTAEVAVTDAGNTIVWYTTQIGTTTTTAPSLNTAGSVTAWAAQKDSYGCESATRTPATVTIHTLPTASIVNAPATVCQGSEAKIEIALTGKTPWSITYNDGANHTINGINSSPYILKVTPTIHPTTYKLVSVTDGNCSNTITGEETTISIAPKATFNNGSITVSATICESETEFTLPDWSTLISNGTAIWSVSGAAKGILVGNKYETAGAEVVIFTYSIFNINECLSTTPEITQTFTLNVKPLPTLTIEKLACNMGLTHYDVTIVASNGTAPYTIAATSGTVAPSGVNKWTVSDIVAGVDVDITVTDDLSCEYTLQVIAPDCSCPVIPSPQTNATTIIDVCFNGTLYTSTVTNPDPSLYTIVWYTTQTGNVPATTPSRSAVGTTTAWAALQDINGCESAVRTFASVTIKKLPTAITTTPSTTICKGNNVDIELELTGVQPWIVVYSDGANNYLISGISTTPHQLTVIPKPESNTTYSLVNVVDNQGCVNMAYGDVNVMVNLPSEVGTIAADNLSLCAGAGTKLTLNSYAGNIQWQRSTTGIPTDFTNISGATSNSLLTGNLSTTTWYRAIITNGVCDPKISDIIQITVLPLPKAGYITADLLSICEAQATSLKLNDYEGTIQWQSSTTSATEGFTNIAGANMEVISTGALSKTTWFRVVITGGGCGMAATAPIQIMVLPTPTFTLTSGFGSNFQTVRAGTPITNITYSINGATGVVADGLAPGLIGVWSGSEFVISGSPTTVGVYPYTITITGTCGTTVAIGIITVRIFCPDQVVDFVNTETYDVVELVGFCWYKENARGYLYQDGTKIPDARPYYYYPLYADSAANREKYGLLYTYDAVFPETTDPNRTICAPGWRLPTAAEWSLLNAYQVDELRTPTHWLQPNTNNNLTQFDARGAGLYNSKVKRCENLLAYTAWWCADATTPSSLTALGAMLNYYCSILEIVPITKTHAISVRCLLDE